MILTRRDIWLQMQGNPHLRQNSGVNPVSRRTGAACLRKAARLQRVHLDQRDMPCQPALRRRRDTDRSPQKPRGLVLPFRSSAAVQQTPFCCWKMSHMSHHSIGDSPKCFWKHHCQCYRSLSSLSYAFRRGLSCRRVSVQASCEHGLPLSSHGCTIRLPGNGSHSRTVLCDQANDDPNTASAHHKWR